MVKHTLALFWAVLLFSQYIYIIVLPKAEQQLQGPVISAIRVNTEGTDPIVEAWNYKTFAILFYGNAQPSQFKGPWSKTANQDYPTEPAPNYTARKHWILNNPVSNPVKIITRCDYRADSALLQRYKQISAPGAYQIWGKIIP
jgi:hypothetical protein